MFDALRDLVEKKYYQIDFSVENITDVEEKLISYIEKQQQTGDTEPKPTNKISLVQQIKKLEKEKKVLTEFIESQTMMMQQTTDYMNTLIAQIEEQNKLIEEKSQELNQQNEELRQYQEEILAHRDFIEMQNRELVEKNKKISYSINAAQRIQQAILPNYEVICKDFLQDVFVIYRPKDIVSGDFYYFTRKKDKLFIAAVDCTGHGIPGAFVSIIGSALLDKIILTTQQDDPAHILYQLHHEVLRTLRQQESYNKDGMDIALCVIEQIPFEFEYKKVTFAGAKRPLWYLPKESNSVQKILPTRRSIGGEQNENIPFQNHTLLLPNGTHLYMASDGFADQNNYERKKIGERKLEELFLLFRKKTMFSQKIKLETFLDEYQNNEEQRDDILLIGMNL